MLTHRKSEFEKANPYTLTHSSRLSPCGHMACQACLKQWFMTPTSEEDPEDPDDPKHRAKTCPQCRTLVTARPVPVFLVKNIIHDLQTADLLSPNQDGEADEVPPPEEDPWAEIFHSPCNCCGGEHPSSDEEYDEESEEDNCGSSDWGHVATLALVDPERHSRRLVWVFTNRGTLRPFYSCFVLDRT